MDFDSDYEPDIDLDSSISDAYLMKKTSHESEVDIIAPNWIRNAPNRKKVCLFLECKFSTASKINLY